MLHIVVEVAGTVCDADCLWGTNRLLDRSWARYYRPHTLPRDGRERGGREDGRYRRSSVTIVTTLAINHIQIHQRADRSDTRPAAHLRSAIFRLNNSSLSPVFTVSVRRLYFMHIFVQRHKTETASGFTGRAHGPSTRLDTWPRVYGQCVPILQSTGL